MLGGVALDVVFVWFFGIRLGVFRGGFCWCLGERRWWSSGYGTGIARGVGREVFGYRWGVVIGAYVSGEGVFRVVLVFWLYF